jgi:hypothetical protein
MAIRDVTALIPPPAEPSQVGTLADWQAVERELGLTLPSDYRDFVFTYGTGDLARFYRVWNPFQGSEFVDLVRRICGYEQESQRQFPERFPYPIYPECPGFLPWGSDDNGNYYGWLTEGLADQWPVLTNAVRGQGYLLHRCSMTDYLARVLRGEIRPLASDYPSLEDLVFNAY